MTFLFASNYLVRSFTDEFSLPLSLAHVDKIDLDSIMDPLGILCKSILAIGPGSAMIGYWAATSLRLQTWTCASKPAHDPTPILSVLTARWCHVKLSKIVVSAPGTAQPTRKSCPTLAASWLCCFPYCWPATQEPSPRPSAHAPIVKAHMNSHHRSKRWHGVAGRWGRLCNFKHCFFRSLLGNKMPSKVRDWKGDAAFAAP